jgi:hypothetical protein
LVKPCRIAASTESSDGLQRETARRSSKRAKALGVAKRSTAKLRRAPRKSRFEFFIPQKVGVDAADNPKWLAFFGILAKNRMVSSGMNSSADQRV